MRELAFSIPGYGHFSPVAGMPAESPNTLQNLIRFGITTLLIVASLLALFFLIWGGISWITSGGDKAGIEAARKKVIYALVGLAIALMAFLIVSFIGGFLGGAKLLDIPTPPACSDQNPTGTCSTGRSCIKFNGHYGCHNI